MTTPAVSPTNPNPGYYFRVNLLAGQTSPGSGQLKCAIITPPATAPGDIVVGTEIRRVFSAEDVKTAVGRAQGFFAYKALLLNDREAIVDVIACAESAGNAATATLTLAGTVTADETWQIEIAGIKVEVDRAAGEAADDAKARWITLINAYSEQIPATASSGGSGVVTLTATSKGPWGNDITTRIKRLTGAGGTASFGAAKASGGTTEPDMTTALSTLEGSEYDYIVPCLSNAEAQHGSSGNAFRAVAHVNALNEGYLAKLQRVVYASTGTFAAAKTNTGGVNDVVAQHVAGKNFDMLPCELAGAEVGDDMRRRRLNPNSNRVLTRLRGVRPSPDPVADNPTEAELADATNTGVTCMRYDATLTPRLSLPVTTRHKDSNANPDYRCRGTNEVNAVYDYAKDLRNAIPQEFLDPEGGQVKIARDRAADGSDEELPEAVVEERDITAFIVTRTRGFWIPKGVIDGVEFEAAVESGQIRARVNDTDETQVDVLLGVEPYKILTKIGLNLNKTG